VAKPAKPSNALAQLLKGKSDLVLVIMVIGILMTLFVPIPAGLLDVLLVANFSFGLLILLLTFYTDKPLSFSTFPSLLLIATLFRLGLNISATRLILNHGDAGQVITTIGSHVVGGNYVIGLVVFFILVVVQYVVVTNGAQRVAEVAARFTLDSMPGKQMSIDADLNMGLIDEVAAKDRRKEIEKEASFYGAMDGASKFVKGDAIAGIIIILIDIIGGLSIGIAQLGMTWGEALHTYTLLTVGDGIVTQIPSLVIATATGIIITRATSDGHLGGELAKQFTSEPTVLFIVGGVLLSMSLMPGLPVTPIVVLGLLFIAVGYYAGRKAKVDEPPDEAVVDVPATDEGDDELLQSLLDVPPIELQLAGELFAAIEDSGLLQTQLQAFRKQYVTEYGFVLPTVKLSKVIKLKTNEYGLYVFGARVAKGDIQFGDYLAIDPSGQLLAVKGKKTKEPTFGLAAAWIDEGQIDAAKKAAYTVVDAQTTLLTHITESLRAVAYELLTRRQTETLINRLHKNHGSMIDELIPTVLSFSDIQRVLQNLLKEKVPIVNLDLIIETLVDKGKVSKEAIFLTEVVRQRLKNQICQGLTDDDGELQVITFEARLEQELISGVQQDGENISIAMSAALTESVIRQLTQQAEQLMGIRKKPVLLCNPALRFAFKKTIERVIPQLHVLSINEIPTITSVKNAGSISYGRL
jgi:flagellar biosynthesis protein FlhA